MERNNQLPEKWYILGSHDLAEYLKTADNNLHKLDGDASRICYYIVDRIWVCRGDLNLDPNYQKITLQQYLDSIKPNNNNNKMKSIEIPEGYNLNLEKLIELGILTKPTQETKKIAETYDEIIKDTDSRNIGSFIILDDDKHSNVVAFIMLLNTASYLNKIYEKVDDEISYFSIFEDGLYTEYTDQTTVYDSRIYFNSTHAINKALDILGEETIKLALKFN